MRSWAKHNKTQFVTLNIRWKMSRNILELSIENAQKSVYNEGKSCLQIGSCCFTQVALCGYIKQLVISGNLVKITLTDGKLSLFLTMFCDNKPESTDTYLQKNINDLRKSLEHPSPLYEKNDINSNILQSQILRFHATFQSLPYIENLKLGDLLMMTGRALRKDGVFVFKSHKTIRILHDKEDYLTNWQRRLEDIKFN